MGSLKVELTPESLTSRFIRQLLGHEFDIVPGSCLLILP